MNEQKAEFAHFLTLCDDYETAKLAYSSAEQAAESIRAAVGERIEDDKKRTAGRVSELGTMIADTSRPASARRVWEQELSRLQGRTFSATPEETAAFDAELSAAWEAVEDMRRLQGEIRAAIGGISEAIRELKGKTLGNPATGLWKNRLDGVRKNFEPLCRG